MYLMRASGFAGFIVLIFISLNANAKEWRTSSLDIYVSVEVPWSMERTDTAGTETRWQYSGSSLLLVIRSEVSGALPMDREELDQRYSATISEYVRSLNGRVTDSGTFVSNGIVCKRVDVAYRQNDSDFVAEAIFILGNHRLYSVQYLHAVSAVPFPAAERAMNSFAPSKSFTPDRQFEKRKNSAPAFERGFQFGLSVGSIIAICGIAYFFMRWYRRNKRL